MWRITAPLLVKDNDESLMFPLWFKDHSIPVFGCATGYWRSCWTSLKAACSSSSPASSLPASSLWRDKLAYILHYSMCNQLKETSALSFQLSLCSPNTFLYSHTFNFCFTKSDPAHLIWQKWLDFIVTVQDSPSGFGYVNHARPVMQLTDKYENVLLEESWGSTKRESLLRLKLSVLIMHQCFVLFSIKQLKKWCLYLAALSSGGIFVKSSCFLYLVVFFTCNFVCTSVFLKQNL